MVDAGLVLRCCVGGAERREGEGHEEQAEVENRVS